MQEGGGGEGEEGAEREERRQPVSAAASLSDGCLNSSSGFILAY